MRIRNGSRGRFSGERTEIIAQKGNHSCETGAERMTKRWKSCKSKRAEILSKERRIVEEEGGILKNMRNGKELVEGEVNCGNKRTLRREIRREGALREKERVQMEEL